MTTGISGSLLLPLWELESQPSEQKVRFLGCVYDYDIATGVMLLIHPPQFTTIVEVDITVPLSTLNKGSLRDGQWVNVIGYINKEKESRRTRIDAISVWPSDGIQPSKYLKALQERHEMDKEMDIAMQQN